MLKLRPITWTVFAIWFVLGLIVYFSYGHRHSVFQKEK
ncbi:amino acid permease C-terminal domain-containing protein [Agrilactobacillus composti]